jgi:Holliday junction resolvase RusA-like endonuclease
MTWPGEPRSKKNSATIVRNGARPLLLPSGAFTAYQASVGWFIPGDLKSAKLACPVAVKCTYYMATQRKVDLLNLLAATMDILVHYGVLLDDNSGIVVSHDGSRVLYDKNNPRVLIEITKMGEVAQK